MANSKEMATVPGLFGELQLQRGVPVPRLDQRAAPIGSSGSTFTDHGMRWDNSGKNGHYAPISWSN